MSNIGQVTTRSKNDWVAIEPGKAFHFPAIKSAGEIEEFWLTTCIGKPGLRGWFSSIGAKGLIGGRLFFNKLNYLKDVQIKIYFDGNKEPGVSASIADFFGIGSGKYRQYDSSFLSLTSGGFYSKFRMPFGKECRAEVTNNYSEIVSLYSEISYKKDKTAISESGYFYAQSRKAKLNGNKPYILLDTEGKGKFIGSNLYMQGSKLYNGLLFLEGDIRFYIDGEKLASLDYTGTEDYFLGGWYFNKGEFTVGDHGCTYKNTLERNIAAYRFFPEGIDFNTSLRIEVDHGEKNEVEAEYSSVAYWYQKP